MPSASPDPSNTTPDGAVRVGGARAGTGPGQGAKRGTGTARPRRAAVVRHDLRAVWLDGIAWSIMVGMGETYFPAFALGLGLEPVWAGLVATVPMVLGALLQLSAPVWLERWRSHRRLVVACAALQAASCLPLAIGAWRGHMDATWLYAWVTVYWAAGLGTAPAWGTWVETIVPARVRIHYFARRNRMLYVFQVVGVVAAGWMLQVGGRTGHLMHAFALVFLFAGLARAISASLLAGQSEPTPMPEGMRSVGGRELLARFAHGDDGRLILYMLALQLSAQVAIPFFTPYVLESLRFSYLEYTILLAAAVASRFVFLPWFGRIARGRGLRALLVVGGVTVPVASLLWAVSTRFEVLLVAQLFAGAAFAAYELASFLLLFQAVALRERTSILTTYHVANSLAIFGGSMLGAAILSEAGSGSRAFVVVFVVSAALRALTWPLLWRVHERRGNDLKIPRRDVR